MVPIIKSHHLSVLRGYFIYKFLSFINGLDKITASQTHQNRVIELESVLFYLLCQLTVLLEHFKSHVLKVEHTGDVFLDFYGIVCQSCWIYHVVDKNIIENRW